MRHACWLAVLLAVAGCGDNIIEPGPDAGAPADAELDAWHWDQDDYPDHFDSEVVTCGVQLGEPQVEVLWCYAPMWGQIEGEPEPRYYNGTCRNPVDRDGELGCQGVNDEGVCYWAPCVYIPEEAQR